MDNLEFIEQQYDEALKYLVDKADFIEIISASFANFRKRPDNEDLEAIESVHSELEDYVSAVSDIIKYGQKLHEADQKADLRWERDV